MSRYHFAILISLLVSATQASSQTSYDSMSQQLEEKIILLEKRISTIEDQLREGKAPIQAPPGKASWRQLKKGMSEAEVEGLLGSPAKIENYGSFSIWNYQKGGSVQFNEDALVKGWFEP